MNNGPITSVLFIAAGAVLIVAPRWIAAREKQARERQLAQREARGTDLYFEERRSLQSYKPLTKIWAIRLVGFGFAALGLSSLYSNTL